MDLENKLAPLVGEIESQLRAFLFGLDFGHSAELRRMIAYHMGWEGGGSGRGKRLRPLITLLCAGACGGDAARAMPAALGIEFLHNFTLVHDDIQDRSTTRHGRPTLWTRWGMAQAINAGDELFSIAQLALLGLSKTCGDEIAVRAAREANRACLELIQGQTLDLAFETDDEIALETYLAMIRGKTAALIAFGAAVGGLVAGADDETVSQLAEYGQNLGMAFQIQDDYLGIWGEPALTGKSTASDLLARKKTLPVLYGLRECEGFRQQWEISDPTPQQIAAMAGMLQACGADDYVKTQAAGYTHRAFEALAALFPDGNEDAAALQALTEGLLHRQV